MTPATALVAAAPALLLPLAYSVWWLDRYRLFPLARYGAAFALASAVGALLVGYWPESAALAGRSAGRLAALPSWLATRTSIEVADAGRLVIAALAVLLVVLARGRIEAPLDGVVFGAAVGVGLALPIGWLVTESEPVMRASALLASWVAPLAAAVIAGLSLACARLTPRWPGRLASLLGGCAAAVALMVGARLATAATGRQWVEIAALIAAMALAAALALLVEIRVAGRELAEEARLGVVPAWVVEVLPRYWRRIRGSWWPRRDERRALSRLLLQLAFRKHRLSGLAGGRAMLCSLEVGRLRERARRLLDPSRVRVEAGEGDE